jgi:hypothetical protein
VSWACAANARDDGSTVGCYIFGHEVNTFSPSPSDSTFWVVGEEDVLQQLRTVHDSLTSRPYEAVWLRVISQRSKEESDGFALSYHGLMEIQRVLEIRRATAAECP